MRELILSGRFRVNWRLVALVSVAVCFLSANLFLSGHSYLLIYSVIAIPIGLAILRYPFIGLLIMVLLIPFEALTSLMGKAASIVKLIGLWTLFSWLIQTILIRNRKVKFDKMLLATLLFSLWALATVLWAFYPEIAVARFINLIQLVGFYLLMINLVDNEKKLDEVIIAFICGAAVTTILSFKSFFIEGFDPFFSRMALKGENPNETGIIMGMAVIFVWYLFNFKAKGLFKKVLLFILIAVFMAAFILIQCRGAWISLAVTYIIYLLFYRKSTLKSLSQVFFLMLAAILIINYTLNFFPEEKAKLINKFFSISQIGEDVSKPGYRFYIWMDARNVWKINPVIGVGLNNFPKVYAKVGKDHFPWDAHSVYVAILCELGLIGFILWMIMLYYCLRMGMANRQYSILTLALLIYLAVVNIQNTSTWTKYNWLVFGLCGASCMVKRLTGRSDFKKCA